MTVEVSISIMLVDFMIELVICDGGEVLLNDVDGDLAARNSSEDIGGGSIG